MLTGAFAITVLFRKREIKTLKILIERHWMRNQVENVGFQIKSFNLR